MLNSPGLGCKTADVTKVPSAAGGAPAVPRGLEVSTCRVGNPDVFTLTIFVHGGGLVLGLSSPFRARGVLVPEMEGISKNNVLGDNKCQNTTRKSNKSYNIHWKSYLLLEFFH